MAGDAEQVLAWHQGRLVPTAPTPARLLVAGSFLVTGGGVVALERHRERFVSSVGDDAVAAHAGTALPSDAAAFWDGAVAELPRQGAWFPRLELAQADDGAGFRLRVRRAPPLGTTVTVATWMGPDPRRVPGVKGPDLEALLEVRAAAVSRGAAEGVLLSPDGAVVDGTSSAIVWWEDGTLCVPPAELPRVDSVTARLVVELAAEAGIPVREVARRPSELAGREVWALNALHGIRRVDGWVDGPAVGADVGRLERWRDRLEELRRPIAAD